MNEKTQCPPNILERKVTLCTHHLSHTVEKRSIYSNWLMSFRAWKHRESLWVTGTVMVTQFVVHALAHTARAWQDFACAATFTTRAVLCRAVTIYRYDGIPRYKHVPCTFAYLRYLEKIKDAVSHLRLGNNFPLNCSLAPPHVQRRQHQRQRPLSLISIPRGNINQNW